MPSHAEVKAQPVIVLPPGNDLCTLARTQPFLLETAHMNSPLNEEKSEFMKNSVTWILADANHSEEFWSFYF